MAELCVHNCAGGAWVPDLYDRRDDAEVRKETCEWRGGKGLVQRVSVRSRSVVRVQCENESDVKQTAHASGRACMSMAGVKGCEEERKRESHPQKGDASKHTRLPDTHTWLRGRWNIWGHGGTLHTVQLALCEVCSAGSLHR